MFKYRISVLIPVYNAAEYIDACIKSLINQTLDKKDFEVILVDDGSIDNSAEICKNYCKNNSNFKLLKSKGNVGPSGARNYAMDNAQGKYIVFLDSDDTLTKNSLKSLADFFDEHEKDIDIVTYKIIPVFNGKQIGKPHYRYQYLTHSGVYDITKLENIFISQTTMNICVKNYDGIEKIRFEHDESLKNDESFNLDVHEDEKYNLEIVRRKMKIGYCDGAQYLYTKNPNSITNTKFYAYYIFESTMTYWEKLFASFNGNVPPYVQALYINDITWKTKTDILLPYHYDKENFDNAVNRICSLLKYVDDTVILNHPQVENPHKFFLLALKENNSLDVKCGQKGIAIMKNDEPLFYDWAIPVSLSRFKVTQDNAYIDAFLRSPIFAFCDKPRICAHFSDGVNSECIEIEPENSAWDYYHAKIKTNKFWRIRTDWDYKKYSSVRFTVIVNGKEVPTRIETISSTAPFNPLTNRPVIFRENYEFRVENNGFVSFETNDTKKKASLSTYQHYLLPRKPRTFFWRQLCMRGFFSKSKIWLYYDCKNVYKDNGYYQFIHDFEINDDVERYYVVNDDMNRNELFTSEQKKHIIKFGSLKHKQYFMASEKIITAFAEFTNINPFPETAWKFYTDMFKAEVIYLQHGVLHAFLPWKYSNDRLTLIDREVISTTFEQKNMVENYGFRSCDLIPAGMPRYDFVNIDEIKNEKKVLFAPTWRKYLVQAQKDGSFSPVYDRFKESRFFKETYNFLHSKELEESLEKNDWYLDFKLHPIFAKYAPLYKLESKRIRIADKSVDQTSYKIFITDFSSFCFDFVYLNKTMMYFIPDDEMFRAGMNDYRKLDLPHDQGFGPVTYDAEPAVKSLVNLIKRNGEPEQLYSERMNNFFINHDTNCRDRIYNAIKNNMRK